MTSAMSVNNEEHFPSHFYFFKRCKIDIEKCTIFCPFLQIKLLENSAYERSNIKSRESRNGFPTLFFYSERRKEA